MLQIKMIDTTLCYSSLDLYKFSSLLNSTDMLIYVVDENLDDIAINKYQIVSIKED